MVTICDHINSVRCFGQLFLEIHDFFYLNQEPAVNLGQLEDFLNREYRFRHLLIDLRGKGLFGDAGDKDGDDDSGEEADAVEHPFAGRARAFRSEEHTLNSSHPRLSRMPSSA